MELQGLGPSWNYQEKCQPNSSCFICLSTPGSKYQSAAARNHFPVGDKNMSLLEKEDNKAITRKMTMTTMMHENIEEKEPESINIAVDRVSDELNLTTAIVDLLFWCTYHRACRHSKLPSKLAGTLSCHPKCCWHCVFWGVKNFKTRKCFQSCRLCVW